MAFKGISSTFMFPLSCGLLEGICGVVSPWSVPGWLIQLWHCCGAMHSDKSFLYSSKEKEKKPVLRQAAVFVGKHL